jgi:hypothetical protein
MIHTDDVIRTEDRDQLLLGQEKTGVYFLYFSNINRLMYANNRE